MPRRSAKFLQEIDIVFQSDDQTFEKQFTVKWERTGNEPGKFLIEGGEHEFNGQIIKLAACRSSDINKLVELISGSVQGKLKREKLDYICHIAKKVVDPDVLKRVIPDLDDCTRGWNRELSLSPCLIYVGVNKCGRTYIADDEYGNRARLVTQDRANEIKRDFVPISEDQLRDLRDKALAIRSLLDQQMQSCYSTFRSSSEELLTSSLEELSAQHKPETEEPNITFTSVIERYIK